MLHPSTQKLIQKLCELTEGGDISWKESKNGHSSIFETEGYKVEVDGEPPTVRLLSSDGRELEKADAADLALAWPGGDGSFATHVADLARQAHRIASGAEAAISRILSSLSAPAVRAPAPLEPEPVPTAMEFDLPIDRKPLSVSAGESAASMAAIAGDMARRPSETVPPPAPAAKPETAIAAVLAAETLPVQPEPQPAPPPVAEVKTPEPPAPVPVEPPVAASPVEERPFPLLTPGARRAEAPKLPPVAPSAPQPLPAAPKPAFGATPSFGSTSSFASAPTPKAEPPKPGPQPAPASPAASRPASSPLFVTGFSAVARPVPRPEPAPQPQPVATPKADVKPEPKPQPEMAGADAKPAQPKTGPDVYKPWSS